MRFDIERDISRRALQLVSFGKKLASVGRWIPKRKTCETVVAVSNIPHSEQCIRCSVIITSDLRFRSHDLVYASDRSLFRMIQKVSHHGDGIQAPSKNPLAKHRAECSAAAKAVDMVECRGIRQNAICRCSHAKENPQVLCTPALGSNNHDDFLGYIFRSGRGQYDGARR